MNQPRGHHAKLKRVLVAYDGPQLAVLDDGGKYVVVAFAFEHPSYKFPLLCAGVLAKTFDAYLRGRVDLLFIFKATPTSRYYICDFSNGDDLILKKISSSFDLASALPPPGIFSYLHTHPMYDQTEEEYSHRFVIDGTWEARDFSRFYGRIADTYSLLYIVGNASAASDTDLMYLQEAIEEKPWVGGGSYLGFYKDLKEHAESLPLRVKSIEYHSPGNFVLSGSRDILNDIRRTVHGMLSDFTPRRAHYTDLYKLLRRQRLLGRAASNALVPSKLRSLILDKAHALAASMGLPKSHILLSACNDDVVIYAKVVLSYFRRTRTLADFYFQGRVRDEDETGLVVPHRRISEEPPPF